MLRMGWSSRVVQKHFFQYRSFTFSVPLAAGLKTIDDMVYGIFIIMSTSFSVCIPAQSAMTKSFNFFTKVIQFMLSTDFGIQLHVRFWPNFPWEHSSLTYVELLSYDQVTRNPFFENIRNTCRTNWEITHQSSLEPARTTAHIILCDMQKSPPSRVKPPLV